MTKPSLFVSNALNSFVRASTTAVSELSVSWPKRGAGTTAGCRQLTAGATVPLTTRDEEGASKVQPGVVLAIQKQPSANTLALTRTLDQVLDEMQPTLPEGMQIHKNLFRQSDFIEHSISNTTAALVEGALFVVVIVVLFLVAFVPQVTLSLVSLLR